MGRGQRGEQQEYIGETGSDLTDPTYGMADRTAGIYWGSPNWDTSGLQRFMEGRNGGGTVTPSGYRRAVPRTTTPAQVQTSPPTSGGAPSAIGGPGGEGVAGMCIEHYLDLMNRSAEFAETGGYSPETIGALRSRALSPVRAVYSDVNRDIDRSRSLQGDYAPGYAATRAKTGREQAYATADATTNVEGLLGQMIQQGRLAGMGGMSSMYGTTPGLGNMFGNQALQSRALANQLGLGMIGARQGAQGLPGAWDQWMSRIGNIGGAIFPFLSDKEAKENIKPVKKGILSRLKKLPISTWSYKHEPGIIHIGPMAQDFYKQFGGESDRFISPVDVAGVTLGAVKELAENYAT